MANTSSFTPQEIEQFLQEFFDVVGARQYVGARYVPIFGRAGSDTVEWDDLAPYEPLTVVMHDGVSYVSRRYVPAGIEISDTAYWVETYRFNAQVEQYRQEVLGFQDQIDARVPFPDPLHYPQFGVLGQVLTTLADGTTKWENPVVPSDEQAEEVITAWLDDHPEATTTVQDGSLTDAKLSDSSSIFRARTNITSDPGALSTHWRSGIYFASSASYQPSDAPVSNLGICELLVFQWGGDCIQVLRKYPDGPVWQRFVQSQGSNARAWKQISTLPIVDSDISATSTIPLWQSIITNDSTPTLAGLTGIGTYSSNTSAFQPSDSPISDLQLCEVLNLRTHGNDRLQVLRKYADGRLFTRQVNSQDQATPWVEMCRLSDAYQADIPLPATYDNLASFRTIGDYKLPVTVYETIAAGASPDFPSDAGRNVYALRNEAAFAAHIIQTLIAANLKTWTRIINQGDGDVYRDWQVTYDPAHIVTTDVLAGKKLVTAGDSYTHAHYASEPQYEGKNYGYYVAQRYGMEFVNDGISGSIMALSKEHVADPDNVPITDRNPFSYQRYLNVPSDADYLTIWFGINDVAHTNLGTINDTTNETFYGAWNVVLGYYLTNRPFLKIGLIVTTGANAQYREAVREVAQKWGYPFLDWEKDVEIPAFFDREGMSTEARDLRRDAFGYNTYSAHPSPQWHEYASSIYENFLRSL